MIINYLNIMRIIFNPPKYNPPLVINPYAIEIRTLVIFQVYWMEEFSNQTNFVSY
jgi:hypothetical protein